MNGCTTPDGDPAFTGAAGAKPLPQSGFACCGGGGALFYDLTKKNLSGLQPRALGNAAQVPATET